MINFYFGNDYSKIYKKRVELIEKGFRPFDFSVYPINVFYSNILETNLFEKDKKILIDLIEFSKIIKDLDFEKIKNFSKFCDIAIFFDKKENEIIKIADNSEEYTLSKNNDIFKLIDAVYSGDISTSVNLFESFKKQGMGNYVFSMLFFPVKNILFFYFDKKSFLKLHPFVAKKTEELSKKIGSIKNFENIINFLSIADFKIKTGSDDKNIFISYIMYVKLLLKNAAAPDKQLQKNI